MRQLNRPRTMEQSTLWALDPLHYSAPSLPGSLEADLSSRIRLSAKAASFGQASSGAPVINPTNRLGSVEMIDIAGALRRSPSLFRVMGCTNAATLPEIESAIRSAARDPNVTATLLRISSPGGEVFGTAQVADAVTEHRAQKPIVAYIEDLGASAAYWIASQASEIVGHRLSHVGSIGVFAVLVDASEEASEKGLKFHVVRSVEGKGSGTYGTEVDEGYLAKIQGEVDAVASLFLEDIARGRGLSPREAKSFHDSGCYVGKQALERGLVDRVENIEATLKRYGAFKPDPRAARHAELASVIDNRLSFKSQGTDSPDCAQSSGEEAEAT